MTEPAWKAEPYPTGPDAPWWLGCLGGTLGLALVFGLRANPCPKPAKWITARTRV